MNRSAPTSAPQPAQPARKFPALRRHALNLLVVVVSTLIGYLVLEFAFFAVLLPNYALGVRPHLPETAEVLVQKSKAAWAPHDYIAVLGDSYAEGVGDWLISNGGNEALPFGPVDVLHALTGRDVVSFGRGGASSAEGLVRQPARILAGSGCMIFPTLEPPAKIVAFFSEGSDVQDNLFFLKKVRARYGADDAPAIDRYLSEIYAPFPRWQCHFYLGDTIGRMVRFALEYRNFTVNDLRPERPGGNFITVDGRAVEAPSPLVGPALEIDDAGIKTAIGVFDRSLAWLRKRFPETPTTMVYVPSTLAIYRLNGPIVYRIEPEEAGLSAQAPPEAVSRHSDLICNHVRTVSASHGVAFIDARPAMRAAAASALITGPTDWTHFNEKGYRTLAGLIASRLDERQSSDPCS